MGRHFVNCSIVRGKVTNKRKWKWWRWPSGIIGSFTGSFGRRGHHRLIPKWPSRMTVVLANTPPPLPPFHNDDSLTMLLSVTSRFVNYVFWGEGVGGRLVIPGIWGWLSPRIHFRERNLPVRSIRGGSKTLWRFLKGGRNNYGINRNRRNNASLDASLSQST